MKRYKYYMVFIGLILCSFPLMAQKSVSITGTINGASESHIRTPGGDSIIIRLTGDKWIAGMGDSNINTNTLIHSFTGYNWDTIANKLNHTHVFLYNDSTVGIGLPPVPDFDIHNNETYTLTVPASILLSNAPIGSTASFTITSLPVTITISGPIMDDNEDSIRNGRGKIYLSLSEDEWEPVIGANNAATRALVQGMTGTSSGSNSWNNRVINAILGSDNGAANVSVSGQTVTIDIPSVPSYNISVNDLITLDIPASALVYTNTLLDNAGTFIIHVNEPWAGINNPGLTEANLNGSVIRLTLHDETFDQAVTLTPSHFTVNAPAGTTISGITRIDSVNADITIAFTGDFDVNFTTFRITALSSGLTGSTSLTSNSITITAIAEPQITDVTIPDTPNRIGSIVPVAITVINDGGNTYSYAGGTVAERALDSLKRISPTQYTGYFTIIEGSIEIPGASIIRVQNLRLDNGSIPGELFSKDIIQANDVIDTRRPSISSFLAVGNVHKIGDRVQLVAIADETGCSVAGSQTSINGISFSGPKMSFTNPPSTNTYYLYYLVEQGDNDVTAPGTLVANLVLRDAGGNETTPVSVSASNTVTIDAHRPIITTLTVPDFAYKIGDEVTLTINADGSGYTIRNDSHVNNIYFSGGRLNFSSVSPGIYQVSYTVLASDPEINEGAMTARIILNDPAGNSSDPGVTIQPNTAAIYTTLPTASISGGNVICNGDSTRIYISLTGKKPWRLTINDGITDISYTNLNNSPFSLFIKPVVNTNYTVKSVYDVNNQQGIVSADTARIVVNQKSPVQITGLKDFYFYRTDSIEVVKLTADLPGGVFSGPGVISSSDEFYPSIAGLAELTPHVIRYDYTNSFGCKSTATKDVYVIKATGTLNFSRPLKGNDDILCFNDSLTELSAVIGGPDPIITPTYFFLFRDGVYMGELPQATTFSTIIDPAVFVEGTYEVYFYYYTKTWLYISRKFFVEYVKSPEFIGFDINEMCSNDPKIALQGTDPDGVFSGRGVSKEVSGKYFFNPGIVGPDSTYIITYTSTAPAGCKSSSKDTVTVHLMPFIGFGIANEDTCLSIQEMVNFINTSSDVSRIREWKWDFGDINSGILNFSNDFSASHRFTTPVSRTIKLNATTFEGCSRTYLRTVGFSDTPIARFSIGNECFVPGNPVLIDSKNSSSIREISNYEWRVCFRPDSVETYSGPALNTLNVKFPAVSIYPVELMLTTDLGCKSEPARDTLVLRPTIVLKDQASYYEETFNDWGSWSPQTLTLNNPHMWLHQVSPAPLEAPADSSWFTVLTGDSTLVRSEILSPCFDFTGVGRPMITMDIYRNFYYENLEGAAMQYTLDNGKNWYPVGKLDDGINWYNSYLINNLPQVIGWTGNPLTRDTGWIEARHGLENLAGEPNVQFRIAFVSNNYNSDSRFAFDHIRIGEKTRLSLLEHFTNTGTTKPSRDSDVNLIYKSRHEDFIKLEYHTGFPSATDPFNNFNKAVPGARVFYYGINSIPYALLDGGTEPETRFDFSQPALSLNEDDISVSALKDPKVMISIFPTINGSNLEVKVKLAAKENLSADEKILFVVLYEKAASHSGTEYINVVKAFLPDAGGTAIYQAWNALPGDTTKLEYHFVRNVNDLNLSALRVAAFLQNDLTGEVYQAATTDTSQISVGFYPEGKLNNTFEMYPNPAYEYVNLVIDGVIKSNTRIEVLDQLGRKIYEEELYPDENVKTIYLGQFDKGIYFVRFTSKGILQAAVKKLVIVK